MRLKELREEKNLSQKQVSVAINTNQSNIARWENGLNEPAISFAIALADFFGVTVDYLIGRTDELGNVAAMPPAAPALAEDERRLLECYCALEPDYKRLAIDTLGTWSGIPTKKGKTSRA